MHGLLRSLPALWLYQQARSEPGYLHQRLPLEYNVQEGKEDDVGNIVHKYEPIPVQNVEPTLGIGAPTDKVFMIEEAQRPGEYMTAFEDEHGTYIMNSKDLRAIAHVERLTKMGVHSLKIEGRTKSFYYCARTAQVYRKAIDDAAAGKPFDTSLLETLEGLAHRGYTKVSCVVILTTIIRTTNTVIQFLTASSLLVSLPVSARGTSRR